MNFRTIIFTIIAGIACLNLQAQTCPTSGTITSDCSFSGTMSISGSTLNVNSGVTITITGNLRVQAGGTLNADGAVFNISGNLEDGYGTLNTIDGGSYNIGGNVSSGSGGSFSLSNASLTLNPGGTYSFSNGGANVIDNTTITGVTTWTSNIGTAGGSDYGVTVTDSDITVSGDMSWHNANTSNTTINVGGELGFNSGLSTFNNSIINSGTGNAGTTGVDALVFNGGGVLELFNDTQMNVRGDVVNNEWLVDDSDVVITGDFDNAGAEILEVRNNGTFVVNGDFDNSGSGSVSADDGGEVQVDGDFDNTGGGSADVSGGTIIVGGGYSGTTPTGDTGDCSSGGGGCCGAACSTLPVELISFKINSVNEFAVLNWKTATELNNDYFIIEKSLDGYDFDEVARIAGNGTINEPVQYSWQDPVRNYETVYYRLTQVDYDGTVDQLGVQVFIHNAQTDKISIYPNPICAGQELNFSGFQPMEVRVLDLSGNLVGVFENTEMSKISSTLSPGNYIISLQGGDQRIIRKLTVN